MNTLSDFQEHIKETSPNEPNFLQAVSDIYADVIPYMKDNKKYEDAKIMERMIEADRIIQFRVCWQDDDGETHVNRGWRVQFNNAIGPYKGGLRFHPSVSLDTFKFLGFEQTFKNALTGQQMGGAKGGADFNPKGKSDAEILRFCHAFMMELYRHIGPDTDIPAGDIGVGEREIGYLFGAYKKIVGRFDGAMTGKNPAFGGSCIRKEATGYGCVYFLEKALEQADRDLKDKACIISGAGNVGLYTAEKLLQKNAKVMSLSDSGGTLYVPDGLTEDMLEEIIEEKEVNHGSLSNYAKCHGKADFKANKTPWDIEADIAIPAATQNEIDEEAAKSLKDNKVALICEAANMPLTSEATEILREDDSTIILPAKAVNAGGVAVSGLERTQNAQYLAWSCDKVDQELERIMSDIHAQCIKDGKDGEKVNYIKGANIAGFERVASAMMAYGTI